MLPSSLLALLASLPCAAPAQEAPAPLDVSFVSGEVTLAGSILLPPGDGPFPGVVLVHGSGTSARSNPWTSAYADALVARGIAVLHPDKRGSGASGGDWRSASFLDLADDALAAVRTLREHPLVDATNVGVMGFSQGGDVVPVAAARDADVAFVVDVSGSVVPILEQIGDELRLEAVREGFGEAEVTALLAAHERAVHYVRTGAGWDAYLAALDVLEEGPHGGGDVVGGLPRDPEAEAWQFLRALGDFDPLPHWKRVTVPTLFVYGGRDENVDVYKSTRRIEEELTPSGLSYGLLLFRNNGHGLFREDALDFVARWIHDRGID